MYNKIFVLLYSYFYHLNLTEHYYDTRIIGIHPPTFAFSCGESRMQKTMERIRTVSDSDTKAAARMMDSISVEVKSGTEYTRMRYDLLKIRIDDKNDVKPMSDNMIAYLVKYFEENGNNTDRQEAYFYAGSVYRDLNDTP